MTSLHFPVTRQWSWVSLSGQDAKDFLHRLTTVNLKFLPEGEGRLGFILSDKGKIQAHFRLWNYGLAEYGMEFDAGADGKWKRALLEVINRYTFAEKMTLTDTSPEHLESAWLFFENEDELARLAAISPWRTMAMGDEIRLCHQGTADFGRHWVTAWGRPARLRQWLDRSFGNATRTDVDELTLWRIEAGAAWVDSEISESSIPLEVGLHAGIAGNKGCYPGQEVIERILSMGAPPRRLVRVRGKGPARVGDELLSQGEKPVKIGELTSVVRQTEDFLALGWVQKVYAKESFEISTRQGGRAVIEFVAPFA